MNSDVPGFFLSLILDSGVKKNTGSRIRYSVYNTI